MTAAEQSSEFLDITHELTRWGSLGDAPTWFNEMNRSHHPPKDIGERIGVNPGVRRLKKSGGGQKWFKKGAPKGRN